MFIKLKTYINFMKYRRLALLGSALLVLLSLVLLITRGLNFGIDFTGGMLLQLEFDSPGPGHLQQPVGPLLQAQ